MSSIRRKKRNWTLIVAVMGLIVSITVPLYSPVSSYITQLMFSKADYTINAYSNPTFLPQPIETILQTSREYYVVTSIGMSSETPFIGQPFRFTVAFENKGKNVIQEPRIIIYFFDFMHRAWGSWNESLPVDRIGQPLSFDYVFPSSDQKTIGSWAVCALLYDAADNALVSYEIIQFKPTDTNTNQLAFYASLVLAVGAILVAIINFLYLKRRRSISIEGKA